MNYSQRPDQSTLPGKRKFDDSSAVYTDQVAPITTRQCIDLKLAYSQTETDPNTDSNQFPSTEFLPKNALVRLTSDVPTTYANSASYDNANQLKTDDQSLEMTDFALKPYTPLPSEDLTLLEPQIDSTAQSLLPNQTLPVRTLQLTNSNDVSNTSNELQTASLPLPFTQSISTHAFANTLQQPHLHKQTSEQLAEEAELQIYRPAYSLAHDPVLSPTHSDLARHRGFSITAATASPAPFTSSISGVSINSYQHTPTALNSMINANSTAGVSAQLSVSLNNQSQFTYQDQDSGELHQVFDIATAASGEQPSESFQHSNQHLAPLLDAPPLSAINHTSNHPTHTQSHNYSKTVEQFQNSSQSQSQSSSNSSRQNVFNPSQLAQNQSTQSGQMLAQISPNENQLCATQVSKLPNNTNNNINNAQNTQTGPNRYGENQQPLQPQQRVVGESTGPRTSVQPVINSTQLPPLPQSAPHDAPSHGYFALLHHREKKASRRSRGLQNLEKAKVAIAQRRAEKRDAIAKGEYIDPNSEYIPPQTRNTVHLDGDTNDDHDDDYYQQYSAPQQHSTSKPKKTPRKQHHHQQQQQRKTPQSNQNQQNQDTQHYPRFNFSSLDDINQDGPLDDYSA